MEVTDFDLPTTLNNALTLEITNKTYSADPVVAATATAITTALGQ